jgi:hypothetical protein
VDRIAEAVDRDRIDRVHQSFADVEDRLGAVQPARRWREIRLRVLAPVATGRAPCGLHLCAAGRHAVFVVRDRGQRVLRRVGHFAHLDYVEIAFARALRIARATVGMRARVAAGAEVRSRWPRTRIDRQQECRHDTAFVVRRDRGKAVLVAR